MSTKPTTRLPQTWLRGAQVVSGVILLAAVVLAVQRGRNFFITADQRGQRLMEAEQYEAAAETFADPFREAVAYYRAADFERAASVFGGLPSAEAAFNQANALVMLGKYEDAVTQYDRALEMRPVWEAAKTNREIAQARAKRLKFEGGDMTGGQMGADGIVFDEGTSSGGETEIVEAGQEPGDEELRAMWLRQVQTTPSDFLRAKFAYQRAMADASQDTDNE